MSTIITRAGKGSLLTNTEVDSNFTNLNTDKEEVSNKATSFVTANDTLYPSVLAVKTYADALVVGLIDDRGSYDASSTTFPTAGGSGTAGAILKGDLWYISVAGTLGGTAVNIGDSIRALSDTPGQTASNWSTLESNIGFVPANIAGNLSQFVSGGAIAPASINGITTDSTTNKPVTAASLNGGTLPASVTTLSTSGNVGIGTTTPGAKLDVVGVISNISVPSDATYGGSIVCGGYAMASAESIGGLEFFSNTASNGYGAKLYSSNTDDSFHIATRQNSATWTDVVKVYPAALAVTGNISATTTGKVGTTLGVGNATPAASGAGVTFPATQSASTDPNTLDDYERGTWTPSLGGDTTYGGDVGGRYVKTGKKCTVWGKIQITTLGTGSTTTLSGLPFASANNGLEGVGSVSYYAGLAVSTIALTPFVSTNASHIRFDTVNASGTGLTGNEAAIFGDGTRVYFTCTYETAN